jgi:uncharacterized membrane protein YtjA (UPF0391 family)
VERQVGQGVIQSSGAVPQMELLMLKWALIFAVVAVIAGLLGFTGIAGAAGDIAKFLFFLFLGVVAFFLIAGVFVGRKISGG